MAAALLAVLDVGEEVLYPRPGCFAYCAVTRGAVGTPLPVDLTWARSITSNRPNSGNDF